MAKVFCNAYQRAEESLNAWNRIGDWDSLDQSSKMAISQAFQTLFDLKVVTPFRFVDVPVLEKAELIKPINRTVSFKD